MQYTYYTTPLTLAIVKSSPFVVTVECPALVHTTISPTDYITYFVPDTATGTLTTVVAATSYMNAAATTCPKTYRVLESPGGAVLNTWVTVDAATGDIKVNGD